MLPETLRMRQTTRGPLCMALNVGAGGVDGRCFRLRRACLSTDSWKITVRVALREHFSFCSLGASALCSSSRQNALAYKKYITVLMTKASSENAFLKKKKKKDFPLNVFRISRTYRFQWPARGHFKKSIWNHSNWTTAILTETMLCMYIIEGFVFCTACGKNTQLDVGLPAASKFWQGRRLWLIISYHWPEILSEQLKRK